eukprot:1006608-Karenia_brevis.AAC.2
MAVPTTPADAMAALVDATDRIVALEARIVEQQGVLNNQAHEMLRQNAVLEAITAAGAGTRGHQTMVDVKTMTPELFGEKKDQPTWRSWSKRMKSYANQYNQGLLKQAMEAAEHDPAPITKERVAEFGLQLGWDERLKDLLINRCRGEAAQIVERVEDISGFEMWRALRKEYDAATMNNRLAV